MAFELSLDYRLRWLDFDRYGRIQPTTVLDLLQDVATVHATQMGIGRDSMLERGIFWALVRIKYEVVREPEHFQVVTVRTWPHSPTRFSFLRDFSITDDKGNTLIKATSEWVFMNLETRKFARMTDHYDESTEFLEERAFTSKPRKLTDFEDENRPQTTIIPSYCDIDLNGHVNNARYPAFAINALNPGQGGTIKTLQIDYRHEALANQPLVIHTKVTEGLVQSKGVREDGLTSFACTIEIA